MEIDWKLCTSGHLRVRESVTPLFTILLETRDRFVLRSNKVQDQFNDMLRLGGRSTVLDKCWHCKGDREEALNPDAPAASCFESSQKWDSDVGKRGRIRIRDGRASLRN